MRALLLAFIAPGRFAVALRDAALIQSNFRVLNLAQSIRRAKASAH